MIVETKEANFGAPVIAAPGDATKADGQTRFGGSLCFECTLDLNQSKKGSKPCRYHPMLED
ncbi:hypothetical protein LR48_Vigan09g002200 [Vigna angularis]|uniref:Uncharacterized protein n=1 Tax=Phaseolus angularis TaxID=3914 RepID=A0A0L9V8N0_PHAAN|nr:hypothetical protein LR48_Vigan09g002200 [Vigna angularis]